MNTKTNSLMDNPAMQKALEAARKAEAEAAAELKSRTDAAAATLAAAREERERAEQERQAATLAAAQEAFRADKEAKLLAKYIAAGGKREDWPSQRDAVIVAATLATPAKLPKVVTL